MTWLEAAGLVGSIIATVFVLVLALLVADSLLRRLLP